jgi:uncharacterized phage protein (TIGR01671 family)
MELRFNVWNKKDNEMIDWFTLNQSAWNTFRDDKPLSLIYDVLVGRKNDFDVLQYIGLNDKNDRPIHSGDICKVILPMGGFWGNVKTEKIGVVQYNEDICGFVVRWKWSKNQHHIQINCDLDIEIIGNIYENNDLVSIYNL